MPLAFRNLAIAQQRDIERYKLVRGGGLGSSQSQFLARGLRALKTKEEILRATPCPSPHSTGSGGASILQDVMYIPSMSFSLLSLQKMVDADLVPVFKEVSGKMVIKATLPTGQMQQVALMTINKGRLKLD